MGLYIRANAAKKRGTPKRKSLDEKSKRELIKVLDDIFSEFIRLRDADDNGWARCITCEKVYPWKGTGNLHCGHYINRDIKAVRYNEINCNSQCAGCNSFGSGRIHIYRQKLVEKYGENEIKELERIAEMGGGYDAYQLREMISEYREKVKTLKKEKGLR